MSVPLQTQWFLVRIPLDLLKLQICFDQRVLIMSRTWFKVNLHPIVAWISRNRIDNYSQHSLIIWSVWLYGWVFVYKVSGCEFESCCINLHFGANLGEQEIIFSNFLALLPNVFFQGETGHLTIFTLTCSATFELICHWVLDDNNVV